MISTPNLPAHSAPVTRQRSVQVYLVDDHEIVRRGVRDLFERAGDM